MQTLIDGLISYIQLQSTGFRSFIGAYISSGNNYAYGPFMTLAPEIMHGNYPYMTFDVIGSGDGMDQGFGSMYTEKPIIRFHLYDTNPTRVGINCELFSSVMDLNATTPAAITAKMNADRLGSIIRKENAQLVMTNEVNEDGNRVYHWIVSYEFRVQRTKGSYYIGS